MGNGGIGSGDFPTHEKSANIRGKIPECRGKIRECFVIVTMETRGITLSVSGSSWFMKKATNGDTTQSQGVGTMGTMGITLSVHGGSSFKGESF